MTDLTVTQEYFVCAAAKNGKISGTEKALCPVAAGWKDWFALRTNKLSRW